MLLFAKTSGSALASATVSGSSGQRGVTATYPASSKRSPQRSQLDGRSQRPCTNTTGVFPDEFARSTCSRPRQVAFRSAYDGATRLFTAPGGLAQEPFATLVRESAVQHVAELRRV